ncbi:MAG TPA: CooT family nickel-binding protein [Candidatus Bathyarchaeota archaeon]|nr:CooT family nickel-binding protein [Candidatus Bathyarchaeota archaeon]
MCELKVIVEEDVAFENVIYAKATGNTVVVRDVLGKSREFKNHQITEVNISKEQLVLSPTKPQK